MYLIDKVEDKYRVHDSLIQNERDQHSQYSLYASYALAFKGDAKKTIMALYWKGPVQFW